MRSLKGPGAHNRRSRHPGQGQRLEMSLTGQALSSTGWPVLKAPAECVEVSLPPMIALHIGAAHLAALAAGGDA